MKLKIQKIKVILKKHGKDGVDAVECTDTEKGEI